MSGSGRSQPGLTTRSGHPHWWYFTLSPLTWKGIDHGARDRADWWAIVLGLGGLVFTTLKWLLIIAVVMPIAGAVTGFLSRGKSKTLR